MDAIKFATTREMYEWMEATKRDGVCSIYDGWTWGHLEVKPNGSWSHVPRVTRHSDAPEHADDCSCFACEAA